VPAGIHPAAHHRGGDLDAARAGPAVVGADHAQRAPVRGAVRAGHVPAVLARAHRGRQLRQGRPLLHLLQRQHDDVAGGRRRAAEVVAGGLAVVGGAGKARHGGHGPAGAVPAAGHPDQEVVVPRELHLDPGDPGQEPGAPPLRPHRRRVPRALRAHAKGRHDAGRMLAILLLIISSVYLINY
jgi:hypothetical protein